ncbi:MAG: DUF4390 domain-containing protein [Vicinamibacterales bacterium]
MQRAAAGAMMSRRGSSGTVRPSEEEAPVMRCRTGGINAVILVAALTRAVVASSSAEPAGVPELTARSAGSSVFIDFDLHPTQTDDLERRLQSGQTVSVLFVVDSLRSVPWWRDATEAHATIRIAAERQTSGAFRVTHTVNGVRFQAAMRATMREVLRDLTSLHNMPSLSCGALGADQAYTIRIRAVLEGGGARRVETAILASTALPWSDMPPNNRLQPSAAAAASARCG